MRGVLLDLVYAELAVAKAIYAHGARYHLRCHGSLLAQRHPCSLGLHASVLIIKARQRRTA